MRAPSPPPHLYDYFKLSFWVSGDWLWTVRFNFFERLFDINIGKRAKQGNTRRPFINSDDIWFNDYVGTDLLRALSRSGDHPTTHYELSP